MAKSPDELLEHLRRNRHGKRLRELDELYRAFGFVKREGGKHLLYFHPDYPVVAHTVTRGSGELDAGYIRTAVERIDLLKSLIEADSSEQTS